MDKFNLNMDNLKIEISKKELDKDTALLKIDNLLKKNKSTIPPGSRRKLKNELFRLKKFVKKNL